MSDLRWLLFLKMTSKGRAVFTKKDIKKNTEIIEFTGPELTKDQYLAKVDVNNNHYLQIGHQRFVGPSGGLDDYINHSCDPNCGLVYSDGKIMLLSIRDILSGEEICFDYSTTMAEDFWEMDCNCGSDLCRGKIRDFKHLPDMVQQRYISLMIVPPFVLDSY